MNYYAEIAYFDRIAGHMCYWLFYTTKSRDAFAADSPRLKGAAHQVREWHPDTLRKCLADPRRNVVLHPY